MARPTKYQDDFPEKVEKYTKGMHLGNLFERGIRDCIAVLLGVAVDTVRMWEKDVEKQAFSSAIKKWRTRRNALFLQLARNKEISPAIWIFLAKNWLKMSDRQVVDLQNNPAIIGVIAKAAKKKKD